MNMVLCFLLSTLLLVEGAVNPQALRRANKENPNTIDPGEKMVRSLIQACREEAPSLCPKASGYREIVTCLENKLFFIKDTICKDWVVARKTCVAEAFRLGRCAANEGAIRCLRLVMRDKVVSGDLSSECTSSNFFKALQLYMRRTAQ
jgi:hypothetical protein